MTVFEMVLMVSVYIHMCSMYPQYSYDVLYTYACVYFV